MKVKTFYSLKKLIRYAESFVKEYDTVSFDLFDTILVRRMHDPDMVKPAVARFIASKAAMMCGSQLQWEEVQELRDKFENEQRARTGKDFDDHEARYPDFMSEVLSDIFKEKMSDDLLKEVTDYELVIEKMIIVLRTDLVVWIKKLYDQGKSIILASDIYLPSDHLKRLIEHTGLLNYVTDIVSSADTFLAKASGKAFPMLQEKHSLNFARWMHIGDNPISDGLRPSEFGIRALVINDVSEKRRKAIAKMYKIFSESRPYWKGRLLQQLMLPFEDENKLESPLYVEGYNFFAPLIGAFIQRIAERTRELDVRKIYFFSREGWTFKKFWEHAMPFMFPKGFLPEISYLYVSRLALAGASCAYQGLSKTRADIAFLPPGNRDMRDLCRVFSLDIEPLKSFMERYGLREDDPLSQAHTGWSNELHYRFVYLLEDDDFQVEVKRQTIPYNDALQCYLEKESFFDQRDVAVADVGWLGTIQRFLYDAVKHRDDSPRVHGFLLGASRGVPYPTMSDNYVEGVVYERNQFDFAASSVMYARDIFEDVLRAPHLGLDGYRLAKNGFELIFRDQNDASGKAEREQDEYFAPLRQGILDAASRFGIASAILGFTFEELKPWLNYLLVSKFAFPKIREVQLLKQKHHLDDFYGKHRPPEKFLRSQRHLWDYSIPTLRWIPWLKMIYYLAYKRRW